MKKKEREEDEEIRRANIRTGFIIAVIVIALFAIVAAVMLGMLSWGFDCDVAKIN